MADYQRTATQYQQQQQQRPASESLTERGPSTQRIIAVVTLLPLGGGLLLLSGLTLAATLLGLAVSAPIFLLFSPVLVPATLALSLSVLGFLASGAFGVTGLSSLTWLANFVRRLRWSSPEQPGEFAKRRVQDTAWYLGQKAKDAGEAVQSRTQGSPGRGVAQEGKKT